MGNYEYWAELTKAEYDLVVEIINYGKNDERSLRARMLKMLHLRRIDSNSLQEVADNLEIARKDLKNRIVVFYEIKFQRFINLDDNEN